MEQINDVDVSGCEYINRDNCTCDSRDVEYYNCEENNNCYYKQLRRKEEELKKLKELNKANALSYVKYRDKYLKEIEDLKNRIDIIETDYNAMIDAPTIKEEKYKQALDEIEKIANKSCTSGCRCIDKTDILQIIQKVKGDNLCQ